MRSSSCRCRFGGSSSLAARLLQLPNPDISMIRLTRRVSWPHVAVDARRRRATANDSRPDLIAPQVLEGISGTVKAGEELYGEEQPLQSWSGEVPNKSPVTCREILRERRSPI
jgi:hypothetical protein